MSYYLGRQKIFERNEHGLHPGFLGAFHPILSILKNQALGGINISFEPLSTNLKFNFVESFSVTNILVILLWKYPEQVCRSWPQDRPHPPKCDGTWKRVPYDEPISPPHPGTSTTFSSSNTSKLSFTFSYLGPTACGNCNWNIMLVKMIYQSFSSVQKRRITKMFSVFIGVNFNVFLISAW